ncbi:MAG: hypothetical protein IH897_12695 [Planctomycetes bacterium]|nr:hypothetical protein [Planctomycetota bacterium]
MASSDSVGAPATRSVGFSVAEVSTAEVSGADVRPLVEQADVVNTPIKPNKSTLTHRLKFSIDRSPFFFVPIRVYPLIAIAATAGQTDWQFQVGILGDNSMLIVEADILSRRIIQHNCNPQFMA